MSEANLGQSASNGYKLDREAQVRYTSFDTPVLELLPPSLSCNRSCALLAALPLVKRLNSDTAAMCETNLMREIEIFFGCSAP